MVVLFLKRVNDSRDQGSGQDFGKMYLVMDGCSNLGIFTDNLGIAGGRLIPREIAES